MSDVLLAYAGLHYNGSTITTRDIREIVETFAEVGRSPLTFGHPRHGAAPKAGNVTRVWASADFVQLWGEVELLEAVRDAVGDGFYDDRSIGISYRPSDGKATLHHVALLGGVPPAVKGMPSLRAIVEAGLMDEVPFDALDVSVQTRLRQSDLVAVFDDQAPFTEVRLHEYGTPTMLARILDNEVRRVMAAEGAERQEVVDRLAAAAEEDPVTTAHVLAGDIPEPTKDQVEAYARTLGISAETLMEARYYYSHPDPMPDSQQPTTDHSTTETTASQGAPQGVPESTPETRFADSPEYREMQAEIERLRTSRRTGEVEAVRQAATGRVPAAAITEFTSLAAALPDVVTFDGGAQESPRRRLAAALGRLPELVPLGRTMFADDDEAHAKAREVVQKATVAL